MLKIIKSSFFLIQHNCFLHRLVVYKQAYDINQEDLTMSHHPTPRPIPHLSRILRKVKTYARN